MTKGRSFPVYEKPPPARVVLAKSLGITVDEAAEAMVALAEAGYGIAPRNPTNGMLVAYLEALTPPSGHEQVVTAIGKARVRWQAMLEQGTAMSLSRRSIDASAIEAHGAADSEAGAVGDESAVGEAETPNPQRSTP